jgi:hypothetical protein
MKLHVPRHIYLQSSSDIVLAETTRHLSLRLDKYRGIRKKTSDIEGHHVARSHSIRFDLARRVSHWGLLSGAYDSCRLFAGSSVLQAGTPSPLKLDLERT